MHVSERKRTRARTSSELLFFDLPPPGETGEPREGAPDNPHNALVTI